MKIKDKKSKELIEKYLDKLQQELSKGKSERLKQYLEFVRKFRNYSFYNTLLIFMQYPNASKVAGFKTWNKLGYKIRKNEKAIRILAPRFYKYHLDENNRVVFVNNENDEIDVTDKDNIKTGVYFVGVNVFDISQTEKTDKAKNIVDNYFWNLGNDFKEKYFFLKNIIENENIKVIETDNVAGAEGYANHNTIAVKKSNDYNNKLLTLIHEWAHMKLHIKSESEFQFTKNDEEIQAEAISYLVGKFLGLDNPFASDYISFYSKDKKDLRNNLKYILETSEKMINEIKKNMNTQKAA